MGLGGSATNDCGTGAAAACGVTFFDENEKSFIPVDFKHANLRSQTDLTLTIDNLMQFMKELQFKNK